MQLPGRKAGNHKKLAARTKSKGSEIEAISLVEEPGEFRPSGGGGFETVDEEVGDTSRLGENDSFLDINDTPGTRSNQGVGSEGLVW